MREIKVEKIKERSDQLDRSFTDMLDLLTRRVDENGKGISLSILIPATDSSISDLRARTAAISGIIKKFDDKSGALIPSSDFDGMTSAVDSIINSISQIVSDMISHNGDGRIHLIENFDITFSNGHAVSLSHNFKSLSDNIEEYLKYFRRFVTSATPHKGTFNFSAAAGALSKVIRNTDETRLNLELSLQSLQKQTKNFQKTKSDFEAILEDARSKNEILNNQTAKAAEHVSNISSRNDEAVSLSASTADLKNRVIAYETEFESFQKHLDQMKSSNSLNEKELGRLLSQFKNHAKMFDEMIEKSDQMLSSATITGLSSEFRNIKDDLDERLQEAHSSFKISILILFLCAIPLLFLILSPFLTLLQPKNESLMYAISGIAGGGEALQFLGQVLARFVILLPGIWFVTFCTNRYNAIFKLKEHYYYKYSVAVSVDGFKKQAPEYQSIITAIAFEQLAFNPADKLGKQDFTKNASNPILDILVKILKRESDKA